MEMKRCEGKLFIVDISGTRKTNYGSRRSNIILGLVTADDIKNICDHYTSIYVMEDDMPDLSPTKGANHGIITFDGRTSREAKWDEINISFTGVGIMYDQDDTISAAYDFGSNPDRLFKIKKEV